MRTAIVDEEEDGFDASLFSHPTVGMKMAIVAGGGQLVAATSTRVEQRKVAAEAIDAPVYSLRRMVPPGRYGWFTAQYGTYARMGES